MEYDHIAFLHCLFCNTQAGMNTIQGIHPARVRTIREFTNTIDRFHIVTGRVLIVHTSCCQSHLQHILNCSTGSNHVCFLRNPGTQVAISQGMHLISAVLGATKQGEGHGNGGIQVCELTFRIRQGLVVFNQLLLILGQHIVGIPCSLDFVAAVLGYSTNRIDQLFNLIGYSLVLQFKELLLSSSELIIVTDQRFLHCGQLIIGSTSFLDLVFAAQCNSANSIDLILHCLGCSLVFLGLDQLRILNFCSGQNLVVFNQGFLCIGQRIVSISGRFDLVAAILGNSTDGIDQYLHSISRFLILRYSLDKHIRHIEQRSLTLQQTVVGYQCVVALLSSHHILSAGQIVLESATIYIELR